MLSALKASCPGLAASLLLLEGEGNYSKAIRSGFGCVASSARRLWDEQTFCPGLAASLLLLEDIPDGDRRSGLCVDKVMTRPVRVWLRRFFC